MEDAIALGADILMLAQERLEECTAEQIYDSLARHFLPIVEYAKEKGVRVVVEDTLDLRLHFCSMGDLKAVLKKVPGLAMAYDSGNMILVGENPVAYYEAFSEKVSYVHIKDMRVAEPGEVVGDRAIDGKLITVAPIGMGMIDLGNVVKSIKQHHYSGYMPIEFTADAKKDDRKTLIWSREYVEKWIAD